MSKLEQAQAILSKPLTLEALQALDDLCEQAIGQEAEQLGDLWEAAMASASPELFEEAQAQGLF
ncbi:hypothetical protein NMS01_001536 [Vibrio cholerae]|uniref:hypothetical protein n=1 Tax=Vibrio cholerae TaxID=666 RepID=UPI00115AC17D|nr:hypothetical protein [Vibrio cholerae]EGR3968117.1 hypothetical protein [Vibrio cholerae]EJL6708090.1 hypothetical protein [Vibrio cholerae]ELB7341446.1 hypothetical protein [Vibrio cholerae]ELC9567499.1 hypothetical protein [Vibrio cholerae]ELK8282287.1 hypothetical protein [Vibrio cholerae]